MPDIGGDGALVGAAAIVGFAVWELAQTYCGMVPSMGELRDAKPGSMGQKLLDTDMCVGGLALIAGGFAAWLSKSIMPLLAVGLAFAWMSYYHRAAHNGD